MGWLARGADRRLDPARVLPGVRTLVVGAVRYGPQPPPPAAPLAGEVSCYAWGEDYHRVVGARAAAVAAYIRRQFDARAVEYVDTGPVLERLWAARAGVGWIGKNALVLNRDQGSFLFLAVVLTDLELPPDEAALDQCGSCSLCVEACPTGAIVEPRVVDSRRCLSYHTIELRGPFPEEHREAAAARVFGCDDCQTACPWNQGGPPAPGPFLPREGDARPDLPALLSLSPAGYSGRFRGTAIKRATYAGIRRNAAVALGNALADPGPLSGGDRARALAALEAAETDPDPAVAEAARWARARAR
jgi:epoxyqueuosine reductase